MLLIVVCDKGNVLHIVHKNLSGNPPRSTGWKERKRPAGRNTLDFCSILCYTPLMNETLTRTICIKLDVNGHDAVLQETQKHFNEAASWIASVCWDERITNTNTAHHRVYGETRSRFGLGAQLAVSARAKAAKAAIEVSSQGPVLGVVSWDEYAVVRGATVWQAGIESRWFPCGGAFNAGS